ncbi:cache domain-containing sensor histidine kinase [Isachenkonia alkalipeptolytica]|uniref:HAMP domain-containing protein n=1 Tax=Isachenkonia alkalipeptolytica TaxID=2565777 RepID=A0AA44BF27_9CLOT|nr:sensor histidine kinase [Isachenkonia alkalipeptolytica]NBG89578.1 HAMP domain-containing protein [Isachenkonia alkalipeptolytica]
MKKSIGFKILLAVGTAFIALFILFLGLFHQEMTQEVIPLTENLTQQLVDAKGQEIDAWFEMRIEEVHGYARNMDYFDLNREEALTYLQEQQQVRDDVYESLGVIDPEGNACITNGACFSIVDREYYQRIEGEQKAYVISQPIESQANEENIVVILHEVEGEASQEVAYVSAAIDLGKINAIARDIQLYEGQGTIIDSEGQGIGTRDPIGGGNPGIQVFDTRVNPAASWRLMFEVEEQQMTAGLWRLQYRALMIGILVAAVLLILLFVLIKSIVYPVRKLQKLMGEVQSGDTKVRFAGQGEDEINQLGGYFNHMLKDLDRIYGEKQEADYRLLQEQVKPHFLYNTLDTIRWSAEEYNAHEVAELVEALSQYFRVGFNQGKKFVTLEEELTHLESYLRIQEARYEERLDYEISYDEALLKERIPKIILQPLAENAINYSELLEKQEKCFLSVSLEKKGKDLHIEVKDNGRVLTEDRIKTIQESLDQNLGPGEAIGFGLYWINHRIKQICGQNYGVYLFPVKDGEQRVGTGVRVIYCRKGGGEDA